MKKIVLLFACIFFVNFSFSQNQASKTTVIKANYFDVSPPLRDMVKMAPEKVETSWKDGVVKNILHARGNKENDNPYENDPIVQNWFGSVADTTIQNFDGVAGDGSMCPPDTDGDVGPNHYFQVVNVKYSIFNKSGVKLLGPSNNSTIFSGLPNNSNDGDAVVIYDEVADRWLFSQFSLPNYPNGPFYENVAISQTADPTGTWYRYQFQFTDMPDYPKIGVWPDGYYMSINRFSSGSLSYMGTGAIAMDRTKMIAGDPSATMILKTLSSSAEPYAVLPSDCDGAFPPVGTPNYFTYQNDGPDRLAIYEFHADWANPTASTYSLGINLPVNAFAGSISGGIPQKGTSVKLDAISGRIMFRLPFRKFSTHWSMVACGTVNVGSNVAGQRWYELRKEGTNPWYIYQQATYSPDNNCRWMGSIAMDTAGNIALGYSISSSTMFPSIRYTGRLATDPLNVMTIQEGGIVNGGGSQTNTWSGSPSRWGDYSAMSVDPSSPATFWYTTEYYTNMSQANWKTRIGSFSFANIFSVTASATPEAICLGESSQLNALGTGGSGTYTYAWTSIPAGFTSAIANPSVTPLITTKYVITLNDGVETKMDTVEVTVAQEPTAFAGNDTTYCIQFPLWPVSGQATFADHTRWQTLGDGTFNNETTLYSLYTPGALDKVAGVVTLTLTAYPMGTCTTAYVDTIVVILDPCTGINDLTGAAFGIQLTPNPSDGLFTIRVGGIKGTLKITVSNIQGVSVLEEQISSGNTFLEKNIDLSKYPKGLYFVKVQSNGNSATGKMMIR